MVGDKQFLQAKNISCLNVVLQNEALHTLLMLLSYA